jgi:hypothetical protein
MKVFFMLISFIAFASFRIDQSTISKKERKSAVNFLKASEDLAIKTAGKLSEAQLKFKLFL